MSDSFEKIIEDARSLGSCTYAHRRGSGPVNNATCRGCMFGDPVTCDEEMKHDLVRRCEHVAAGIGSEHGDGAGRSVNIGEVATFPGAKADKAQALKVLEEAAEVFGAWQEADDYGFADFLVEPVLDECADVIQATCNLIAGLGASSFVSWMDDCRARNEERGRL